MAHGSNLRTTRAPGRRSSSRSPGQILRPRVGLGGGEARATEPKLRAGHPVGPEGHTAEGRWDMKAAGVDPAPLTPAAPAPTPRATPQASTTPAGPPGLGTRKRRQRED